ncbi:MAG TPA: quinol:electron acceptor oxidoreductase subunit ActD [Candidatus Manganitrophaceae bacterium]|nr:quinol:electron acceptor oxidoreductase subunit ActD [Candidatus Manganitrophaceae bacterium]
MNADKAPISVSGLFQPTTPVEPILDQLRRMDLSEPEAEISSTYPILAQPVDVGWRRFKLYHVTLIAGAFGILFGILLSAGTFALYPLRTGGKPIVSMPIVGIVSFETMMLFAIVSTFITSAVKIIRSHRGRKGYDARIDEGFIKIAVRVARGDPRSGRVQTLFQESGAVEVEVQ